MWNQERDYKKIPRNYWNAYYDRSNGGTSRDIPSTSRTSKQLKFSYIRPYFDSPEHMQSGHHFYQSNEAENKLPQSSTSFTTRLRKLSNYLNYHRGNASHDFNYDDDKSPFVTVQTTKVQNFLLENAHFDHRKLTEIENILRKRRNYKPPIYFQKDKYRYLDENKMRRNFEVSKEKIHTPLSKWPEVEETEADDDDEEEGTVEEEEEVEEEAVEEEEIVDDDEEEHQEQGQEQSEISLSADLLLDTFSGIPPYYRIENLNKNLKNYVGVQNRISSPLKNTNNNINLNQLVQLDLQNESESNRRTSARKEKNLYCWKEDKSKDIEYIGVEDPRNDAFMAATMTKCLKCGGLKPAPSSTCFDYPY